MPTFGKLTDGSSSSSTSSDRRTASSASPATSGVVTKGTGRVWITVESTVAKMIIYDDATGALLAVSDEVAVSNNSEQAIDFPFSGANQITTTAGTVYWIGYHYKDPGVGNFVYSRNNDSGGRRDRADTYSDGPADPWGTISLLAGVLDCYITYTENVSSAPSQLTLLGAG